MDVYIKTYHPVIIYEAEAAVVVEEPQEVQIEVAINWKQERIEQEIRAVADKYGVSYEKLWHTVKCESGFVIDVQSHHVLGYGREQSYGLAQFHIPSRNRTADGTVITKELALNPAVALDAMAYHFSKGNAKAWSCYRQLYM